MTADETPCWMRYASRLARVHDYIHTHLDTPLDLNRLAEIACLSPYHWHRVYRALYGESILMTVRRMRIVRASEDLVCTALPIARIARRAGYGSTHAFTRAFRDAYGVPPVQHRRAGVHRAIYPLPTGDRDMFKHEVAIRRMPELHGYAIGHTGSYLQVNEAFARLGGWVAQHGLFAPGAKMLGIYYDDPDTTPEAQLRSKACFVPGSGAADIAPAPPVERVTVAGGEYAVLLHTGPYADLKAAYQWLYGDWLRHSGREAADAPPFELYLNTPMDTAPADLLTELYLPLR
ncbi:AraC family transcriptional regulator [Burkholderia stagnalis]|uniref:AraC family transcriptional regulator n=1 Tax=Burkholderia stagnalis TaxID=1503054 RepID=A0ABX9YWI2_9BURK|nr:AraC family transcriptional regulator [Burkholderia stagnalis]KVN10505.1 AraC family transcriptional regulator [Burkholderia stagnalis]KVX51735.1 AraC family transcriptional regulator [Burkholderia stagnalis]RQQ63562.1 AraC family transcriptional regulator [Burkholderia stagnalis]RQQ70516.1 AraC family transcriptional regulator [Burkholderia stagnalis]RQQ71604.1 AraC family transcriptional regulator [Burkholderia stagnalis]